MPRLVEGIDAAERGYILADSRNSVNPSSPPMDGISPEI